jgi:hypothetical protein
MDIRAKAARQGIFAGAITPEQNAPWGRSRLDRATQSVLRARLERSTITRGIQDLRVLDAAAEPIQVAGRHRVPAAASEVTAGPMQHRALQHPLAIMLPTQVPLYKEHVPQGIGALRVDSPRAKAVVPDPSARLTVPRAVLRAGPGPLPRALASACAQVAR